MPNHRDSPDHDDPQPWGPPTMGTPTKETPDHGDPRSHGTPPTFGPPNHTDPQLRRCRPWGTLLTTKTPNQGDSPMFETPDHVAPALTQLLQDPPALLGAGPRPPPADHRTALPGPCGAVRGRSGAGPGGAGMEPGGWVCSGDFGSGGRGGGRWVACTYMCVCGHMHVCACTYMRVHVFACTAVQPHPPHPAPSRGEQTALREHRFPPPRQMTHGEGMQGRREAGGDATAPCPYNVPIMSL